MQGPAVIVKSGRHRAQSITLIVNAEAVIIHELEIDSGTLDLKEYAASADLWSRVSILNLHLTPPNINIKNKLLINRLSGNTPLATCHTHTLCLSFIVRIVF